MLIDIAGYCPACGTKSLHVHKDVGMVHCLNPKCPRSHAAHEILSTSVIDHLVVTHDKSWTLMHPLIERLDNAMLTCPVSDEVATYLADRPFAVDHAVYRVTKNDLGDLLFQGLP